MPNAHCGESADHAPHDWHSTLAGFFVRCPGAGPLRAGSKRENKHPCERGHDICPCWDGQGCCLTFSPEAEAKQ